ncbi:MAG: hypothetical protein RML92_04950 [Bacteroidia bacterium]|nr:hypothetical protein [Bacteroidia bacterium]
MRAYWMDGVELAEIWRALPYTEAPFDEWAWWERFPLAWGAVVIEDKSLPLVAIPFAVRRLGVACLYRQPLILPWIPFRLAEPLPDSPPVRYRLISHILSALGVWAKGRRFSYLAGGLPSEWSYLPALNAFRVKGHGSFVVRVGGFEPSKELFRKVRQTAHEPLRPISPQEAYEWWSYHRPKGVSLKLSTQLKPLLALSEAWHTVGIGMPLRAVGFFLNGRKRLWYIAGASVRGGGQSMTRILYEAILFAHSQGKDFDFQGSVIPGIERFFRQFGGEWEPRYFISAWRF